MSAAIDTSGLAGIGMLAQIAMLAQALRPRHATVAEPAAALGVCSSEARHPSWYALWKC
jgi:hypothetical protein